MLVVKGKPSKEEKNGPKGRRDHIQNSERHSGWAKRLVPRARREPVLQSWGQTNWSGRSTFLTIGWPLTGDHLKSAAALRCIQLVQQSVRKMCDSELFWGGGVVVCSDQLWVHSEYIAVLGKVLSQRRRGRMRGGRERRREGRREGEREAQLHDETLS